MVNVHPAMEPSSYQIFEQFTAKAPCAYHQQVDTVTQEGQHLMPTQKPPYIQQQSLSYYIYIDGKHSTRITTKDSITFSGLLA